MEVRELFAVLGLDVDETSFAVGELAAQGVVKALEAVGEVAKRAAEGLVDLVTGTAAAADHIDEAAQRAGVSTDVLQRMAYAAQFSSISMEDLAHNLGMLSRMGDEALKGNMDLRKSFEAVGISLDVLRKGDLEDQLSRIAEKFQEMPDGPKKTALAMQLFSRGGQQMIPFLNTGSKALEGLADQADEFGVVLDKDTIAAGSRFQDNLDRIHSAVTGVKYAIGGPLLEAIGELLGNLAKWISKNRDLIAQPLVKTLKGITAAVTFLSKNLWILKGIMGTVTTYAVLRMLPALAALEAAQISWGLAALISGARALAAGAMAAAAPVIAMLPWLALAALIFLVGEDIYQFFTGGNSLLGEFGPRWTKFLDGLLAPMADDGFWLGALKGLGRWLTDIQGETAKLWAWLIKGFADTLNRIGQAWDALKGGHIKEAIANLVNAAPSFVVNAVKGAQVGTFNPATGHYEANNPGADFLNANSWPKNVVSSYFGGGASPMASAQGQFAARASPLGPAPNVEINQTVQIPAGLDPKQAGDYSADAISRLMTGQLAPALASQE